MKKGIFALIMFYLTLAGCLPKSQLTTKSVDGRKQVETDDFSLLFYGDYKFSERCSSSQSEMLESSLFAALAFGPGKTNNWKFVGYAETIVEPYFKVILAKRKTAREGDNYNVLSSLETARVFLPQVSEFDGTLYKARGVVEKGDESFAFSAYSIDNRDSEYVVLFYSSANPGQHESMRKEADKIIQSIRPL